jgi:hypothetical protein
MIKAFFIYINRMISYLHSFENSIENEIPT